MASFGVEVSAQPCREDKKKAKEMGIVQTLALRLNPTSISIWWNWHGKFFYIFLSVFIAGTTRIAIKETLRLKEVSENGGERPPRLSIHIHPKCSVSHGHPVVLTVPE